VLGISKKDSVPWSSVTGHRYGICEHSTAHLVRHFMKYFNTTLSFTNGSLL